MSYRFWSACLAIAFSCSLGFAGTFTVTVKVVDAQNNPMAKADVALFFQVKDGAMKPNADAATVTGDDGKATLRVDDWNRPRPVMVLSADRSLGGVAGVSKENDGKELTVALVPTVHVKGTIECKQLNLKPEWANTMIFPDSFGTYFSQDITKSASLDFVLPAGKYSFASYGTDVEQLKYPVELKADQRELDLGVIDLKPEKLATLKGKVPPDWVIADARGVPRDVKLADFKGKWLYLEFWGYW